MPIMQEMGNSMSGYNEIGAMNFADGFLLAGGKTDMLRKILTKEYDLDA